MPTNIDYAKIAIACKDLGIDRHTLLADKYGVISSKDLTGPQVRDLLAHLRAKGWRPRKKAEVKEGRSARRIVDNNFRAIKKGPAARQQRYILALWNALGYDVAKLDARCKKQFGIDRIEWVVDHDQLHVLITDLQARCEAAGINPDPEG
jgi:ParB-like chromosome segregation protein Spo0J